MANGTLRACQLPLVITGPFTLPARAGTIYSISGRTEVGLDGGIDVESTAGRASLTIEPGVKIFGSSEADYLVVNRGSRIFAEGTSANPVIFTSLQNVEGVTNDESQGQWGGIVIAGRAPQANCQLVGPVSCTGRIAGTTVSYGGNTPTDDSGRLRYVQIRYAGRQATAEAGLGALTLGAVGSSTTIEYIQVHNSAADGVKLQGGNVQMRYLVVTGADDDGMDIDLGWRGGAQFAIVTQRPTNATDRSSGLEFSSEPSSVPLASRYVSAPNIANFTIVGRNSSNPIHTVVHLDTGADPTIIDAVFTNASTSAAACLDVADADTFTSYPFFGSTLMSCRTPYVVANQSKTDNVFNRFRGTNIPNAYMTMTAPAGASLPNQILTFINGSAESRVETSTTAGFGPFFVETEYVGAVRGAADTWYLSWTCGLSAGVRC